MFDPIDWVSFNEKSSTFVQTVDMIITVTIVSLSSMLIHWFYFRPLLIRAHTCISGYVFFRSNQGYHSEFFPKHILGASFPRIF
ncbi:hypothetical protein EJB05_05010 [Eragrostis curvula]|uniref:Uncharacterized protein n=1 Tax=Eragrostis curvula TaxID=38414 RepID=A0A5J9WC08_9POAL|nr:hypothetical protein EJB05_05010 [Eragrostis curvula]